MNVLMVVSWYTKKGSSKLEAGVFHYEQAMDLKKYCNTAIYFPFDQDLDTDETCSEEWGLLTYRSHYTPGKALTAKKQMRRTFARIIKEYQPDVLHAHCGGAAGYYMAGFAKKYKLPFLITEHSPLEISHVDRRGLSYYMTKKAFKSSALNICVSNDSKQKLSRIYPDCRFEVIYNGIRLPDCKENIGVYYCDGYLNIVIVAILYDLEVKGMNYLLEAMRLLKHDGKKILLHHIGGGEYLNHFKQMAENLGIDDICIFHGSCSRNQLYEIVKEMDFFVSASLYECSGVSVEEAMLLGKPVLGTNSGGVDSLVPDFAGHIVEKANAQALYDGICYMDAHLSEFDTDAIRAFAQESFEISHISLKYLNVYEKITGGHYASS